MKRHTEYERLALPPTFNGKPCTYSHLFIIKDDYTECKLNDFNLIKRCKLEDAVSGVILMTCQRLMCVPDKNKAYVERIAYVAPDYVKEFQTHLELSSGDFIFDGSNWKDDDTTLTIVKRRH